MSLEKKTFEKVRYFCHRKPYCKKDRTPKESERTTWFWDVWTLDGKITFKRNDSNPKVYYS